MVLAKKDGILFFDAQQREGFGYEGSRGENDAGYVPEQVGGCIIGWPEGGDKSFVVVGLVENPVFGDGGDTGDGEYELIDLGELFIRPTLFEILQVPLSFGEEELGPGSPGGYFVTVRGPGIELVVDVIGFVVVEADFYGVAQFLNGRVGFI